MKTIITAIAATLFTATATATATASASDVYHGLEQGNPDLVSQGVVAERFAGVQPGVGDSFDVYGGLADGNTDLFKSDRSGPTDGGDAPDIYMSVSGNPDLQF